MADGGTWAPKCGGEHGDEYGGRPIEGEIGGAEEGGGAEGAGDDA